MDVVEYYIKNTPNVKELSPNPAMGWFIHFQRSTCNNVRKISISRQACESTSYLWMECVHDNILPDPTLWGWARHEGRLIPRWQNYPTMDIASVLTFCVCVKRTVASHLAVQNRAFHAFLHAIIDKVAKIHSTRHQYDGQFCISS